MCRSPDRPADGEYRCLVLLDYVDDMYGTLVNLFVLFVLILKPQKSMYLTLPLAATNVRYSVNYEHGPNKK